MDYQVAVRIAKALECIAAQLEALTTPVFASGSHDEPDLCTVRPVTRLRGRDEREQGR